MQVRAFHTTLAFLFRRVRSQSKNFGDENFADSKSSVKTAKITYLENLYVYGNSNGQFYEAVVSRYYFGWWNDITWHTKTKQAGR